MLQQAEAVLTLRFQAGSGSGLTLRSEGTYGSVAEEIRRKDSSVQTPWRRDDSSVKSLQRVRASGERYAHNLCSVNCWKNLCKFRKCNVFKHGAALESYWPFMSLFATAIASSGSRLSVHATRYLKLLDKNDRLAWKHHGQGMTRLVP